MAYKKVTCPLKHFEVEPTEEFKQLIKEGWKVDGTQYNPADMSVTFFMVKDET